MKRFYRVGLAALVAVCIAPHHARAATISIPTAGIAITSVLVGAFAATESALEETRSKWNRKVLGIGSILILTVDPPAATYFSGTSVIAVPDTLQFEGLTWYGAFSDMSMGDTGPVAGSGTVQGSGFHDEVSVFTPQGANPDLSITSSINDGVLTVGWSSVDGIMAVGDSVNMFGMVFSNISGRDLPFFIASPSSPNANLYQMTQAQSLVCIPAPGESARTCGYPDEPLGFRVPEPSSLALLLAGLVPAWIQRPRKRVGRGAAAAGRCAPEGMGQHGTSVLA